MQFFKYKLIPRFLYTHLNSLVNGSSLLNHTLKKGNITNEDLTELFPNGNTIDRVVISGKSLQNILVTSLTAHKNVNLTQTHRVETHAHFQMSGIKIKFQGDSETPTVESIKTACKVEKECSPLTIEEWCEVNITKNYVMALSSEFTGKNGTGIGVFKGLILEREVGDVDRDVFSNYVKECSPVKQVLRGRIINSLGNVTR